jgi:tetratricopeptide (TPR) repeat protein
VSISESCAATSPSLTEGRQLHKSRTKKWPIRDGRGRQAAEQEVALLVSELSRLREQPSPDPAQLATALRDLTRQYALLGNVDDGVPTAEELISYLAAKQRLFSTEVVADAYNYLAMLAFSLREAGRFSEALELDEISLVWFRTHGPTFGEQAIDTVVRVAADYAGLGDFDSALDLLDHQLAEVDEGVLSGDIKDRILWLKRDRTRYERQRRRLH